MPLHFQTVGRIFGIAARTFTRFNRYESKIFDAAYSGFPRSIRRGARHGYIAGSVLGQLINEDDGTGDNGFPQQGPSAKAGKFSKARSGYTRRFSRRNANRCYPNRKRRQSRRKQFY